MSTALVNRSTTPRLLKEFYSVRSNDAVALHERPHAMQLAALPTTLMTHVVLRRTTRTCCASAAAAVFAAAGGAEGGAPHPCALFARHSRPRVHCWCCPQWTSLVEIRAGSTSTSAQPCMFAVSLIGGSLRFERLTSPSNSVTTDAAAGGLLFRVSAAASPSSSSSVAVAAAGVHATGSLHTSKRHYGTAAASESTEDSAGAEAHAQERHSIAEEDEDALYVPPSFEEVYNALRTLRLVGEDGRAVRAWTAADIKRAYRALAKELHPDVSGGGGAGMEQVNAAYACLTSLPAEVAVSYRSWLETGGEEEMLVQRTQAMRGLVRWASRDVAQLMIVGWCATFSCLAAYASWWVLFNPADGSMKTGVATPCKTGTSIRGATAGAGGVNGKLTLLSAGAAMSAAPGVQYGVVSSGSSFMYAGLSLRGVQLVRAVMSRYVLAVALTLAACVNTVMIQRVLTRLIAGAP
ncbi:DNAJ-domain transmembrane-like protein [Leptomonas seymouri]|uniref:DNAJ-domain transmembrane-like protein n=1 Tax=Leptomonas seymouri TaxID=5684 RepID=A0A0N1ILA2_LEPSE|nr:DNAJ-domain transmembrane-like protein [Leptomonas seymouri]|eukprot:KPI87924.1 DNAJ-domain transmembrane-like protein [Leptomonas seymouri]